MKTTLPTQITSDQQAKDFLYELHKNGESFHPDELAETIMRNGKRLFTDEEAVKINDLMSSISEFADFDPSEYLLELSK